MNKPKEEIPTRFPEGMREPFPQTLYVGERYDKTDDWDSKVDLDSFQPGDLIAVYTFTKVQKVQEKREKFLEDIK